jgi:phosphoglycerol transferase MdoB-like AlkP superfamily enzyme
MQKRHQLVYSSFGILFSQLIFWMLFFTLSRSIFLLYQSGSLVNTSSWQVLRSFYYGWKMDLSMTAYLLILPYLLVSIRQFVKWDWIALIIKVYFLLLSLLMAIIISSELELYVEWGVKLNYKALKYLENPSEVWGIASTKVIFLNAIVVLVLLAFTYFLYPRLCISTRALRREKWMPKLLFILLTPGILLLLIRGGVQQVPMNQSTAYFSENNTLNNAAVNSVWNVMFSVLKSKDYIDKSPYDYYDTEDAQHTVKDLYDYPRDSTTSLLTVATPNIVYLILEGWSSDMIGSLSGFEGVTPSFDALTEEGYLFTEIYASGLRSHEGMAAIFSGFPAQPQSALTSDPSKYPGLPVMNTALKSKGYFSFFGFGGELNYGNIKSYLVHAGFDKIVEDTDFPILTPRAKLGVHDEYALPRFAEELDHLPTPFFASWFTLSSHAPYDIPIKYTMDINGTEVGYLNAVHYADSCLGVFFNAIKNKEWYANTLFVVLSDHGHSSPKKTPYYDPDYRKIPVLFYGEVLKREFRGKRNAKMASQCDFTTTVLRQLGLKDQQFAWSKDIMNPSSPPFAYYVFDDGLGWVEPGNHFSYHHELNRYMSEAYENEEKKEAIRKKGKSYLQVAFKAFLNL